MDKITFTASLPPSASAVKIHGEEGIRITLDIPESDFVQGIKIVEFKQKSFKVTIEE